MPKRPRTHQIADQAINRLHAQFEQLGWTVEDLNKDYGEDLFVRIFDNEVATPFGFFVQAKATDKMEQYFNSGDDAYIFPIEVGHLRHWVRFAEPVFLTLYDLSSDQTFWVCVQYAIKRIKDFEAKCKKKKLCIAIPRRNLLDTDGLIRMRGIVKMRFERNDRARGGATLLIDLLEQRFHCKIKKYDPDDEVIWIEADCGYELIVFGKFGAEINGYAAELEMEPQELLDRAIESLSEELEMCNEKTYLIRLSQEIEESRERDAGKVPISGYLP